MSDSHFQQGNDAFSNDSYWDRLDGAIDQFEKDAEGSDDELNLEDYLPNGSEAYRQRILVALIKMDLERKWKAGQAVLAEHYFERWPEIGNSPSQAYEIVESECRTRAVYADAPEIDEIKQRFPQFAKRLDVESRMINDQDDVLMHSFLGSFLGGRTSAKEEPAYSNGQMLGRYRVERVIDQGGMGTIYLAHDTELDREVAIKVLHSNLDLSDRVRQLLLDEARMTAKLQHPSIVPVYDVGHADDGRLFFVMEYVSGKTLAEHIGQDGLTRQEVVDIAIQIGEALHYAHKNKILHRDIKPPNIIIGQDQRVRITDFGLALPFDEDQRLGEVSGTLPYMAPELLRNQSKPADVRVDLWAVGVVMFEMLTGSRPFQGRSKNSLMTSIESRDFPQVKKNGASQGLGKLEPICRKCLNPDPDKRYSSASEMVEDLKKTKRQPIWQATVGLVLLAVVSWVLINRWQTRPFQPPAQSSIAWLETCPELKDCGLVLVMHTRCQVDLESTADYVKAYHPTFLDPNWLRCDSASQQSRLNSSVKLTSQWISWEFPFKFSEPVGLEPTSDWFKPEKTSLVIKVAVSRDGTFQIGTKADLPQEQLAVLAQSMAVDNYSDFNQEALTGKLADTIVPKNASSDLSPKNTLLAHWLAQIYIKLHFQQNLVQGGPGNLFELTRCPFELRNYFEEPITVVEGRTWHHQFDQDYLQFNYERYLATRPKIQVKVAHATYDRWSPILLEDSDQDYRISQKFQLGYDQKKCSALFLIASVDDDSFEPGIRNSAAFVASGMKNSIDPWPPQTNRWIHRSMRQSGVEREQFLSATGAADGSSGTAAFVVDELDRGRLTGVDRRYGGSAVAFLYNKFPDEIEITAYSRYSTVRPLFRMAMLGKLEVDTQTSVMKLEAGQQVPYEQTRQIKPNIVTYLPYQKKTE